MWDFNDFIFAKYPKTGEVARSVCQFMEKELKKLWGKKRSDSWRSISRE